MWISPDPTFGKPVTVRNERIARNEVTAATRNDSSMAGASLFRIGERRSLHTG
jgi:hypothetical protein